MKLKNHITEVVSLLDVSMRQVTSSYEKVKEFMSHIDLKVDADDSVEVHLNKILIRIIKYASYIEENVSREVLYNHVCRVYRLSHRLIEYTDTSAFDITDKNIFNPKIILYSSLLHDIGKALGFKRHVIHSYFMSLIILDTINITDDMKISVLRSVLIHSNKDLSTSILKEEVNINDLYLMDADMMDDISPSNKLFKYNYKSNIFKISETKKKVNFDSVAEYITKKKKDIHTSMYKNIKTEAGMKHFNIQMKKYDDIIDDLMLPNEPNSEYSIFVEKER